MEQITELLFIASWVDKVQTGFLSQLI